MKKWIALCVAVSCALAAPVPRAQTWPQRPVKVIVPFTAGGNTDTAGASGAIAAELVAKAPADGYTLFFAGTTQFLIVPLIQKVNYDPLKDFAPISVHIPYKGGAQSVMDLVGGQVQMVFGNASDMIQHSKSGKIRLLAVSSEKRAPQFPDLPAIAELYPGFRNDTWNGFFAPAATPRAIIDRVAQEVAKAAREPGTIERLNKIGVDALGNTPAEFAALIRSGAPVWRDAVEAAGIKQE